MILTVTSSSFLLIYGFEASTKLLLSLLDVHPYPSQPHTIPRSSPVCVLIKAVQMLKIKKKYPSAYTHYQLLSTVSLSTNTQKQQVDLKLTIVELGQNTTPRLHLTTK